MLKIISGQFSLSKDQRHSFVETLIDEQSSARVAFVLDLDESKKGLIEDFKKIFSEKSFQDDQDLLLRFESCMKEVNDLLRDKDTEVNGAIAIYDKTELHVSQAGEGEAYLIRRGKLNVIIENIQGDEDEEKESDVFTSIASGELLVDDRVIFSSLRVLRYATVSQMVNVLSEGISEGIDAIKDLIQLEVGTGALLCWHTRGESVFSQAEDISQVSVPRYLRASFFSRMAERFDRCVQTLSEKTGKNTDLVQSSVFAALGVLFSILLIWVISSASIDNTDKERVEAYKVQMLKIEKELQTAETRSLMDDMASANAILDKIENTVQEILNAGMFTDESLAILERVQKQRDDGNKITRVKNVEERVLTNFTSTEEEIAGFEVLNNEIYLYSNTGVYKSVLDHIDPKRLIDEQDVIVKAEAMDDQNIILLTLASGIIKEVSATEVSTATTSDEGGFKLGVSSAAYSRYLYVLSAEDNQFYKYERKREGFTAPSPWLKEESIDLSGALDFDIDGSVYVLKQEGGVSLFHKGQEIALNVQGDVQGALVGTTQIFVKPDMRNVYFLNPARNSVVVFEIINKGLQYQREYIFETKKVLNDFYIDTDEQKLVVSDSDNLYELSL